MDRGKQVKPLHDVINASPEQCLHFEENNEVKSMELYEENIEKTEEESFETMFEDMEEMQDITDASSALEEYSQHYGEEDTAVQCVPEIPCIYSSEIVEKTKAKIRERKKRPRMKITPKRKTVEKMSSFSDDDFPKAKKEGTWIQCSKNECLKWRKLPNDIEPLSMPERWVCAMNPDQTRTNCTASQETCDSQEDFDVVYTPFVAGSLVWAKVPGYPWWPGMVEDDPDYKCCYETDDSNVNPISYHVSFIFDKDVSRSWVSCLNIRNFNESENVNELGRYQKRYNKPLARALVEAKTAINMSLLERLHKYSFSVLYKGNDDLTQRKTKTGRKRKQEKNSPTFEGGSKMKKRNKKKKKNSISSMIDNNTDISMVTTHMNKDNEKSGVNEVENNECDEVTKTDSGSDDGIIFNKRKKLKKRKIILPLDEENDDVEDKSNNDSKATQVCSDCESMKENDDTIESTTNENHRERKDESYSEENRFQGNEDKAAICSNKIKQKKTVNNEQKKKKREKNGEGNKNVVKRNSNNQSEELKVRKKKMKEIEHSYPAKTTNKPKKTDKKRFPSEIGEENVKTKQGKEMNNNSEGFHKHNTEEGLPDNESLNQRKNGKSPHPMCSKETAQKKKFKKPFLLKKKYILSPHLDVTSNPNEVSNTQRKTAKPPEYRGLVTSKNDTAVKETKIKKMVIAKPKSKKNDHEEHKKLRAADMSVKGSSMKWEERGKTSKNMKQKTVNKMKKVKQGFGKFIAPVKSKVSPEKIPKQSSKSEEKCRKEAKETLEEVLNIPHSDDPRDNPESYVSIDSLEKDMSDLYQELSQTAAQSTGVDDDDLHYMTEANDSVTMEFLNEQICRNTTDLISNRRKVQDSPEF